MHEAAAHAKANARMYAVNQCVEARWTDLFAWVSREAGVPLEVVAHAPPRPLAALWQRSDLGCAFICGYPWSTWPASAGARPHLLGAPVPAPPRYGGTPVYWTDIVVRDDSRYGDIDALRDARFGYTVEHSQSGWQAPRAFFAARALGAGGRWFGNMIGPLHTPRAVAAAVLDGRIDAGPLDSWWHDLLKRHEPSTAGALRTIARTPATAIPPLIASAGMPQADRERLTWALERVGDDDTLAPLRDALLLSGFARATATMYDSLACRAASIDALGYPRLR